MSRGYAGLYHREKENDRPWVTPGNRNTHHQNARNSAVENKKFDSRYEDPDRWSSTIFITNFPPNVTRKGLRDTGEKVGRVVDIYMPDRVSNRGKRFGFIRFVKGSDINAIIEKVRAMWIGRFHLYADKARFGRERPLGDDGKKQANPKDAADKGTATEDGAGVVKPFRGGMASSGSQPSYAQAIKDGFMPKPILGKPDSNAKYVVKNFQENQVLVSNFDKSLLVKVRDPRMMAKVFIFAHNEGFYDVQFRYLGGLWLRVDCDSTESCSKFAKCSSFKEIFQEIKHLSEDFVVDEKIVWVEVRGLPLVAWSNAAFHQVACRWGKCLFSDDDVEEPLAFNRVCLLTRQVERIRDSAIVEVNGKFYDVLVTESHAWSPSFEYVEEEDESDEEEDDNAVLNENVDEHREKINSDPFELRKIIENGGSLEKSDGKPVEDQADSTSNTYSKPPGFSKNHGVFATGNSDNVEEVDVEKIVEEEKPVQEEESVVKEGKSQDGMGEDGDENVDTFVGGKSVFGLHGLHTVNVGSPSLKEGELGSIAPVVNVDTNSNSHV
ncbi:hypothetical protein SSX86_007991 [Deinandra increscens subsp. villosa]|uniref:RRM domain-containing protein n=1 Tax=Deinandra increscens subsp. villosa TaxID=3103831 RepID=A0AAP0H1P2_9ASTR